MKNTNYTILVFLSWQFSPLFCWWDRFNLCPLWHDGWISCMRNMIDHTLPIETKRIDTGDYVMKEMLILIAVIAVWYALQAYILPKMGISTWIKPSCQVADKKRDTGEHDDKDISWNFAESSIGISCQTIIQEWRGKSKRPSWWLISSAMDNMAREKACVWNAGGFLTMSRDALKDVPFGKISPDAQNVLCIAINLTWGWRSGRWWNMQAPKCSTVIPSCQGNITCQGNKG